MPNPKREALKLALRLRGGKLAPQEAAEVEAWLREDAKNAGALKKLDHVVGDLLAVPHARVQPRPERRAFLIGTFAASTAIGLAGFSALGPEAHATQMGEQKQLNVAGIGAIILNTDSRLLMMARARTAWLIKGEAFFDLAPSSRRHFTVHCGSGSFRCRDAKFSLHRHGRAHASAILVDGKLEAEASERLFTLNAGERFTIVDGVWAREAVANLERALLWRTGFLEFEGEPLSTVAEEVARYTGADFILGDKAGAVAIRARFRANDLDSFLGHLRANAETFRVERRREHIEITKRS